MANVDLYCERLAPGLLAEPLNAATNAAFFVSAWLLWRRARRLDAPCGDVPLLLALMVAIGFGSALFHTLAVTWARVLDVLPILLFQLAFVWIYSRRAVGMAFVPATILDAVVIAAALYGRQFPYVLNGSLTYAPALLVMFALGFYHWRHEPGSLLLLAAGGLLSMALFLRTIDAAVCEQFPFGTHFLWHVLIAVVLYLCVRALLDATLSRGRTTGLIEDRYADGTTSTKVSFRGA